MSLSWPEGLRLVRAYGAAESWLAVLVTLRGDGQPSVSVVNAGVVPHPVHGEETVAFVARSGTAKLTNLRRDARATLVFRASWNWVSVTGTTELAGPDDPLTGLDPGALPALLRAVYAAAGGVHPDLPAYDRAMATERRVAVLLTPTRFTTNPSA